MSVTVGRPVPAFTATSTAGEFSLSDYAGKTLILYFYPKDATPGCTTEGQNFRDRYKALQKANADILGVSRDSLASSAFVDLSAGSATERLRKSRAHWRQVRYVDRFAECKRHQNIEICIILRVGKRSL